MSNNRQRQYFQAFLATLVLSVGGCGSDPSPATGSGNGGASGHGGSGPGGGTTAETTGGATGMGGLSSGGGPGSGGVNGTGGVIIGSGGTSAAVATGGSHAGGIIGTGGVAPVSGGASGHQDAGSPVGDAASGSGGARTGGATGSGGQTGPVATGGTSTNRDGGLSTGGTQGTGGATGTTPGCATDESSKCTSSNGQIKCDFGGGDGNYDVTVELGGTAASDTYVDAEMYRRMLPELSLTAGQTRRFSFTANVRSPEGQPVQNGSTGSTPGLQIYFRGPTPKVNAICHQTASKPVMLWLGGDSTVCDQNSTNYTGWGQRLPQLLQGVAVANYADSGEGSGSFLGSSAMFGAIKSRWKSGDWFLVQMGHNDKNTTAATFQSNMKSYVTQAKAAGVNVVLITPISRVGYTLAQEHVNSTGANLPQIIRDLGKSENVPVIDLTVTTWNWIQSIAPKDYFAADASASGGYDHTHLGPKGADAVAGFVRDAIKANPGVPALAAYLR